MKVRMLIFAVFVFSLASGFAGNRIHPSDSSSVKKNYVVDTDSLLEQLEEKGSENLSENLAPAHHNSRISTAKASTASSHAVLPAYIEPTPIDSLLLENNVLFIDLVYTGKPQPMKPVKEPDFQQLYFGFKRNSIEDYRIVYVQPKGPEQVIVELRRQAREYLTRTAVHLYAMWYDELPDPEKVKSRMIEQKSIRDIKIVDDSKSPKLSDKKLIVKKEQLGPWRCTANSLLQFSQNMSSNNWYQGGNSSMAVLGILSGQAYFDNKKGVQWENNAEWRMGFNAVFNDPKAKRAINTNDDVIRLNSKLGIRASENFFYSTSVDFSTQLLHNYQNINSEVLKASFLSPVRFNMGIGMDYKFKRSLSLMLAPVSYKYIYVLETDPKVINPNMFGIKTGENHLSEIGSSFRAQYSFSPFKELQVDSRLTFYTNYEKVEADWEIVGNFTVNRFLSTRISLNPRYDNTVIGEKAKIQFKEWLSFGFSYKLLR